MRRSPHSTSSPLLLQLRSPIANHVLSSGRGISFNGHAWISSLRYGFPFGPQLGSFVHQYCEVQPQQRGFDRPPPPSTEKLADSAASRDPRTLVLDDISNDPELGQFPYDMSPCYAGPGQVDAKAAKLLMQRRHNAAVALHCKQKQKAPSAESSPSDTAAESSQKPKFQPTLTFDLLRQIREMYRMEMLTQKKRAEGDVAGADGAAVSANATPPRQQLQRGGQDYFSGSNRATSALDEVFLDDAAIYARALVYVSGGSRLARDWIAGCAALCTNHPSLVTIAMHHQGTHEDLEDFARYCEIVGYCDDQDCSLQAESQLCEKRLSTSIHPDLDLSSTLVSYNAGAARCGLCDGDGVIIDLPVPLAPQRQADIIKRCLVYDAMTALHFMEFDADLLDLSRIRAASNYLRINSHLVEQLREVVLAEHSLIAEKHATIDAPAASAEGAARLGARP